LTKQKIYEMFCSLTLTGLRAEKNVEVEAKMKELFQTEGLALLDVITDPDKM
jgi:thiamine pyrophosphate-dependent acetolactate synthase large subunit-like protein